MSERQALYITDPEAHEVIAEATLVSNIPHYNAQKRRMIAILEELMAGGHESFLLSTGRGDWTIEPLGPARIVRR